MITIICPLSVELERKTMKNKKYYLNLNNFRNRNFIVSNQIKHKFCELMQEQLKDLKFTLPIDIEYTLYYWDNRKRDKWNILSIIQKFFLDSLVYYQCIIDDNDNYINKEIFNKPKKSNDKNSYCIIEIKEIL